MDTLKGLHPKQQQKPPSFVSDAIGHLKTKRSFFTRAGIIIGALILCAGVAQAVSIAITVVNPSLDGRIADLNRSYDQQNEIIRLAQDNLAIITRELAYVKIEKELKEEEPNNDEISRLNEVARNAGK